MQQIQEIYYNFIGIFPNFLHPFISLGLALLLVYAIFQAIKQNFIWIVAIIILLPASVPILKSSFEGIVSLIKFLLP